MTRSRKCEGILGRGTIEVHVWVPLAVGAFGFGKVSDVVWADDQTLVACDVRGRVQAFDREGRRRWRQRLPSREPCGLGLGPNGVVAGVGGALVVLDPDTGETRREAAIWESVVLPHGGSSRHAVFAEVWTDPMGKQLVRVEDHQRVAAWVDTNHWWAAADCGDGLVAVLHGLREQRLAILDLEEGRERSGVDVRAMDLAVSGSDLFVPTPEGLLRFPLSDGVLGGPEPLSTEHVAYLEHDPTHDRIFAGSSDGRVAAFRASDGERLWQVSLELSRTPLAMGVSPDGSLLAIGHMQGLSVLALQE